MDVFKISVPNGIEVGTFDNTISFNIALFWNPDFLTHQIYSISLHIQERPYDDLVMNSYCNQWGLDHTHTSTQVWKNNQDFFQKELQIVFSIAFSTCGRINCDITQMQLQILHYLLYFRLRKRTVTATFQMKNQSPFATVFPMSYELWACHI